MAGWRAWLYTLIVPILAVVTALAIGGVIIALTGGNVLRAYQGLWEGSFGQPRAISNTLVRTTPYIFGGLAVALAFKGGLFNIGVEGQITMGSLATAFVGYAVTGVPFPLHLVLALLAGFIVGGLWGAIPGFLKAFTGAHEVIVTIMLNYVAIDVASYLLGGPLKDRNPAVAIAQTAPVLVSARLPPLLPDPQYRVHWGIVLGVLAAIAVWWLLQKTTLGFEIRTVGANPNAARYAGISVGRTIVVLMALSGGLAGLAGALDVVGLNFYYAAGLHAPATASTASPSPCSAAPIRSACCRPRCYSADWRRVPRACSSCRQIPIDIIQLVQALILIFVAAPTMIRWLYRLRLPREAEASATGDVQFGASWGKAET